MNDLKLGIAEARFADIVWEREPISTKELVNICQKEFDWKRTTTYTVLKRLCEKGLFKTENSIVDSLVSREEFYSVQSSRFVDETFNGSLPAFLAAFTSKNRLSAQELSEIQKILGKLWEE